MGRRMRVLAAPLALAAIAIGVVLAAPLASPNKAAAGPIISGAQVACRTRSSVSFAACRRANDASDVHILAFNDLHGNAGSARGQNIYGQFAGGAAYLAKVVKDEQAQYGVAAGDRVRGRQHRRQPARERAVPRRADHDCLEPDARRLRVRRQPRVRRGLGRAAAHSKRRLPSDRRLHGGSVRARERRRRRTSYPGADFQYLSANVVTDCDGRRCSRRTGIKQFTSTDDGKKFKVGFIGEVLESTPTIVTPTGVAGLTFQDEADAANRAVAALADKGVKIPILVIHQGGFQSGAGGAQRLRRQPRGQRHRRDRDSPRSGDQGDRLGAHACGVPLHDHRRRRDAL